MTTNPEAPKNNPASAPSKVPSDTLLKNFHSILDQRWKEFDAAVVAEAGIAASFRGTDERYIKAKATFDEAKAIGNLMKDDDMLKTALNSPGRLGLLIDELNVYFKEIKEADKTKQYNHVLGNTLTDLTTLRSQVTQAPQDQLKAKEVATAVAALPAATVVLGGTGVGGIMAELQSEVTGELQKELGPWGMIFKGVDGVPTKDVAEQVKNLSKEYSEKKWTSDPFDKLMAMFQLMFLKFRIGKAGMDLSGDMTPEEMKLAGIKGGKGNDEQKGEPSKNKETIKKDSKNILYAGAFSGLIVFHQGFLSDITQEKDGNKNKERIGNVFRYHSFYELPYEKAKSLYTTYKNTPDSGNILKEIGVTDPKSPITPRDIVAALGLIVDEKLMSTKTLQKNIGQNKNISVGEILTASHGDWAIVNDFEKIDPTISADPSKVFSQVFGNIGARFYISKDGDTYKFTNSETQEQAEKLGMDAIVLGEIMTSKININSLQESEIDKQGLSDKTKELLRKILAFWKTVKGPLAKDFSFGQESQYKVFYDTASIAPISLLKLYLVTGGNIDLTSMASPRKMGIYAIIRESFFDGPNKDKGAELFDKSIISIATTWAMSPTDIDKYIPKDVQEAMGNISSTIADNVIDSSWGMAHRAWLALPSGWKIGAGIGITLGIMLIWRLRVLKYVGIGAGIGAATAAGLFATAVYAGLSESDKKKFPEEEIKKGATKGIDTMLAKTE